MMRCRGGISLRKKKRQNDRVRENDDEGETGKGNERKKNTVLTREKRAWVGKDWCCGMCNNWTRAHTPVLVSLRSSSLCADMLSTAQSAGFVLLLRQRPYSCNPRLRGSSGHYIPLFGGRSDSSLIPPISRNDNEYIFMDQMWGSPSVTPTNNSHDGSPVGVRLSSTSILCADIRG